MNINRDSFNESFLLNDTPDWNCSSCYRGKLIFVEKDATVYETNQLKMDFHNDAWEPDWVQKYFVGVIRCSYSKCQEVYTIAGNVKVEQYQDERGASFHSDNYCPQYFFPVLHIFQLPEDISGDIEEAIINAFKIFWIDKSSCGNAIRKSVEVIMDDKKVPKYMKGTEGKRRRRLNLHERIVLFDKKYLQVSNHLMAIKWIGNAGSHNDELWNDDLLDAFEILKDCLEKLYGTHHVELAQMIKRINLY